MRSHGLPARLVVASHRRFAAARWRCRFAARAAACAAAICALHAGAGPCLAQDAGARVQPAPWPALDARSCEPAWVDGLQRLLQIELGGEPAERSAGEIRVEVRCDGDLVDIEVSASGPASGTHRRMDLSTTAPSVRARVLALAIAGLVRELALIARSHAGEASSSDGAGAPAKASAPRPAPAPPQQARPEPEPVQGAAPDAEPSAADSPPEAPEAPEDAATFQLDLLAIAGNFAASSDLLWSAGARVHYLAPAPLHAALDLQVGAHARDTALGSVGLLAGSLGARLGWTFAGRPIGLTAGAGQRAGIARASATAGDALRARDDAVVGAWTATFAFATLEAAVSRRVRLGLDAEVGAVLLPVHGRVDGGDDIAVDGLWAALAAAFGVQF